MRAGKFLQIVSEANNLEIIGKRSAAKGQTVTTPEQNTKGNLMKQQIQNENVILHAKTWASTIFRRKIVVVWNFVPPISSLRSEKSRKILFPVNHKITGSNFGRIGKLCFPMKFRNS